MLQNKFISRKEFISSAAKAIWASSTIYGVLNLVSCKNDPSSSTGTDQFFVTDNTELEEIRKDFIENSPLKLSNILPKLQATWSYAKNNYFQTTTIDNNVCTFVSDPSQGGEMVSEALAYGLRITALLTRLDPANKIEYQQYFDQILNGINAAIKLAQDNESEGALPAWAFKIESGVLVLDTSKSGPQNSAADADLDIVEALLDALENVKTGIWSDNGYGSWLLPSTGYVKAIPYLFEKINGLWVTKPSEDWNDYKFGDYPRPATLARLSLYYRENNNNTYADYWETHARDSMLVYFENLFDTENIPATENIAAGSDYQYDLSITELSAQSWDGIRGPFNIAMGLRYIVPNNRQLEIFAEYLKTWQYGYTVSALDSAMYLPLALALGNIDQDNSAEDILDVMDNNFGTEIYDDPIRYYQTFLRTLSVVHLHTPIPNITKIEMPEIIYPRSTKQIKKTVAQSNNRRTTKATEEIKQEKYAERWKLRSF
jgi:hypothetical protein